MGAFRSGPAAVVALLLATACAGDPVETARDRALRYFRHEVRAVDPGWAHLFGYYRRRFGLEAFDAEGRRLHEVPSAQARPQIAALYARLTDPAAAAPKRRIAELESAIDRITVSALHCDRIALPQGWLDALRAASRAGGYALTHAALAGQWSLENGCVSREEARDLQAEQVRRLEGLVEARDELARTHAAATDLWIEALAMLHYLGAGARVRGEWLEALLNPVVPRSGQQRPVSIGNRRPVVPPPRDNQRR